MVLSPSSKYPLSGSSCPILGDAKAFPGPLSPDASHSHVYCMYQAEKWWEGGDLEEFAACQTCSSGPAPGKRTKVFLTL